MSQVQPLEGFINHSLIAAPIHPRVQGLSLSPLCVTVAACLLSVPVAAPRAGASWPRTSAGVCTGRAPGGRRRSRVPCGSSEHGRAPGRCVRAARSCCAGPAGPCTHSAASSPTAYSTTTTQQPCPADRSAGGRQIWGRSGT